MGGNKGYKGIDKRVYIDPTPGGRGGSQGHLFQRRQGEGAAPSIGVETYQLTAEDWTRAGWSASFSPDSGSKLFHSPDTTFGSSWESRQIWSNVTVKCHGWEDPNEKAIISFRIGNCFNGNTNGSYYGMGGFTTFSDIYKTIYTDIHTNANPHKGPANHISQRINWYCSVANKMAWSWYQTALGNLDTADGDLIEIIFSRDGVIKIVQNGSLWITLAYNETWSNDAEYDHDYMPMIQSSQEGADGNYPFYDFKYTGVVTKYPNGIGYEKFATQFDQTMLPMQADGWESGSYTPSSVMSTGSATTSGSCVTWISNGSYTTPMWTRQFITGSGAGGIYMMTIPSASSAFPINPIAGVTDHSLVTGYNYYTNVLNYTGKALAWNTTYTPGAEHSVDIWYQYSITGIQASVGGLCNGPVPMTSGSKIAFVITGSDPLNKEIFGGREWNYGSTTEDGAQTVAMFLKPVDTSGNPINDYVSGNWILAKYGIWEASGKGRAPKKLIFNRGQTGDHFCHIEVGDNYVASGSF